MQVRDRLNFFSHIQAKAKDWCLNYSPDASPSERALHAGTMSPLDYLRAHAPPGVSAANLATSLCRFAYAACDPRAKADALLAVLTGLMSTDLSPSNCIDALHALPHSVIWTLDRSKVRFDKAMNFLDQAYQLLLPGYGLRLNSKNIYLASLRQCKSLEQLRNLPHPSPSSSRVSDIEARAYTPLAIEIGVRNDKLLGLQLASQLDRSHAVYEAVARLEDLALAYGDLVQPTDFLEALCLIVQPPTMGVMDSWFENHRPFLSAIGRLVSVDRVHAFDCAWSIARIPQGDAWKQVGSTSELMGRLKVLMAVAYAKLGERDEASFNSETARIWITQLMGKAGKAA